MKRTAWIHWERKAMCKVQLYHKWIQQHSITASHLSPVNQTSVDKVHSRFLVSVLSLSCIRSLNELRVLLLESHRHSRDMEKDLNREVHKAEWKVKEQKLQDDIKTLREKLLLLVRQKENSALIFQTLVPAYSPFKQFFWSRNHISVWKRESIQVSQTT